MKDKTTMKIKPVLNPIQKAEYKFYGFIGNRILANQENWLMKAPVANPGMIQMFADRDRNPRRQLMPWSGEFAGKYLISAVQGYRLTRDEKLLEFLKKLVKELISVQDKDGYLGPHPKSERFAGKTHDNKYELWDLWGHYHCMLGLLLWWQETGYKRALDAVLKSADCICKYFLGTGRRVIQAGAEEMNMAVIHIFCILYELTGNKKYIQMAGEIEKDWETPPAGDYVRTALGEQEFFNTPKPRWESLHDLQAIPELYFITGEEKYKRAILRIWNSIKNYDRHNTGGFSSAEQAVGNPYDTRAIETCCVIAWTALSIDLLRMTGDSRIADEIELTTFNSLLGAQHPSGRWWTYNTPMDGVRLASAHQIVFQAERGTPELNCCSVNAPRALGMISEWGFMKSDKGIVVNYYGPCEVRIPFDKNEFVAIKQTTDYPAGGNITIGILPSRQKEFTLAFRIPSWSRKTKVMLNKTAIRNVVAGNYIEIKKKWKKGDEVKISFDMTLKYWKGEKEFAGKVSLYCGPLLLAYDQSINDNDPDKIPALDRGKLKYKKVNRKGGFASLILLQFNGCDGIKLNLCDFASAGARGVPYVSWLPFENIEALSPENESPFAVHLDK